MNTVEQTQEMEERPTDYTGPDLDPAGLVLRAQTLGPGVHALMANRIPKDNNGLIVGDRAALVEDAGINTDVSRQIQGIAATLSSVPLRYLANTTYHGDHTFGNAGFDRSVTIVSSRRNRESMIDLEREKRMRRKNLRGNDGAIADVTEWRRPDIVFETHAAIDLGGRLVHLWYFGPGNAPGDTVVYEPETRTAWTGNFLMAKGLPGMLLEGGPGPYIETLRRMHSTLDIRVIVPGHGPMGEGVAAIENLIAYLEDLRDRVEAAMEAGLDLESTQSSFPTSDRLGPPEGIEPTPELREMSMDLHRLNVLATYRALERARDS